eukprot:355005-Chlamydomonas_euryale.AAC.3
MTGSFRCVCDVTILDSSTAASQMDQIGSAHSYPTSTTARCRRDQKSQGPEKGHTKTENAHEGSGPLKGTQENWV